MDSLSPRFIFESALNSATLGPVAGVDEAGRGACAGPLVISACILPMQNQINSNLYTQLRDSKKLSPRLREYLSQEIKNIAVCYSIIAISAQEIDADGLHNKNLEGIRRAVHTLDFLPGYALIDGYTISGLPCPSLAIIKGDDAVVSISAASILAKATRDTIMRQYDELYPDYGFAQHKGYGTMFHQQALNRLGPCPQHRLSFANVRQQI